MEKNCTKKAIDEFDDQCKKENCEAKQLKILNYESYIGHVTWPMQKNFEKENPKIPVMRVRQTIPKKIRT